MYYQSHQGVIPMILPNVAPIVSSSPAVSREGAVADFIFMSSSPVSAASVITPKPASHDHFKTGQAWQLRTFRF
jgi:hypothetical protein